MSFITDPSGSIYASKTQGAAPPLGRFYAADANLVRQALLDIHGGTSDSLGAVSSSITTLSSSVSSSIAALSASMTGGGGGFTNPYPIPESGTVEFSSSIWSAAFEADYFGPFGSYGLILKENSGSIGNGDLALYVIGLAGRASFDVDVYDAGDPGATYASVALNSSYQSGSSESLSFQSSHNGLNNQNEHTNTISSLGALSVMAPSDPITMYAGGNITFWPSGGSVNVTSGSLKLEQVLNLGDWDNSGNPQEGDIWKHGTDIFARISGTTYKFTFHT